MVQKVNSRRWLRPPSIFALPSLGFAEQPESLLSFFLVMSSISAGRPSPTPSFVLKNITVDDNDSSLKYSQGWERSESSNAFGGAFQSASGIGDIVSFSLPGTSIVLPDLDDLLTGFRSQRNSCILFWFQAIFWGFIRGLSGLPRKAHYFRR